MSGIAIGLDMLYYAILKPNTDTVDTPADYETPIRVPGLIQATVTPTTNSTTLYADDQADEVATSLGDIALSIVTKNLPTSVLADWLGHQIDTKGALVRSKDDVAPYLAIGYRRRKSNGAFRYVWNFKGRFQPETQEANTKTDTPSFQTPTINATFIPRTYDGQWQYVVDSDDAGVDPTLIQNWFASVPTPTITPTP
jgi:phi13 family phage major tail protein